MGEKLFYLIKGEKPTLGPLNREVVNITWIHEIHSSSMRSGIYIFQSLNSTHVEPILEGRLIGNLREDFDMFSFYRTTENLLIHFFNLEENLRLPLSRQKTVWINMESLGFNLLEFFRKLRDFETTGYIRIENRVKREVGYVFLQGGLIVDARLKDKKGSEAFEELFTSLTGDSCLFDLYELNPIVLNLLLSNLKLIGTLHTVEETEKFARKFSNAHSDAFLFLVSVSLNDYGYKVYLGDKVLFVDSFDEKAPLFEVYAAKEIIKSFHFINPEDYGKEDSKLRILRADDQLPITYFCPACWSVISQKDVVCPNCGYNLNEFHNMPYEYKLIMALEHPIREMRLNVIHTIGKKDLAMALPHLEHMVRREADPIVLMALADALIKMSHPEALETLRILANHRYPVVRSRAKALLERKLSRIGLTF